MLFIDLDGFKEVNDALGHESGDGVLRDVARRIAARSARRASPSAGSAATSSSRSCRPTTKRPRSTARGGIIAGIEQLGATLTRFPLSASIGIASGHRAESAEQLLHRADQAMYRAKARGPGKCELAREHETAEPGRISAAGPISTVS